MSTPTTDDDSSDCAIAAITALPGAAKDLYGVLHISFFTIGLNVGAYTGALAFNPLAQYFLYACMKGGDIALDQTIGTTCRMEVCVEKSLVGIDVANAGDHRLIQQEWF